MGNTFDNYALDQAVKVNKQSVDLLRSNRNKMWTMAYGEILSRMKPTDRILDYGCGAGEFLKFLSMQGFENMMGFDPSGTQVQASASRALKSSVKIHNSLAPLDTESPFDWIFCHHVVEHIRDSELDSFFGTLASKMTPNGRLIISTPNGLNPLAYAYFMTTDRTHVRMHSAFTLAELGRTQGLEIVGVHRELPQAYDFKSSLKTLVSVFLSPFLKLAVLSVAAGSRGLGYPLNMWSTFYVEMRRRES